MSSTRERVRELMAQGLRPCEIADVLGVSRATVSYHRRQLGEVDARFGRRYTWDEVQAYYDEGHSLRQCMARFGFSSASWYEARLRGEIVARPARMPIEEILRDGRSRGHIKRRLIAAGLKEPRCEICGIDEWLGKPLSLALHHLNGVKDDDRLENLQLLCPNCHSQTDNFSGRNKARLRLVVEGDETAGDDECAPGDEEAQASRTAP